MKTQTLRSITNQKSYSVKGDVNVPCAIISIINSLLYVIKNVEMITNEAYELYTVKDSRIELESNLFGVSDDIVKSAIKSSVSDITNLIAYAWYHHLFNFAIRKYPDYAAKHVEDVSLSVIASGKNSDVRYFIKDISVFLASQGHTTVGVEIDMYLEVMAAQLTVFINKLENRSDLDLEKLNITNVISRYITSYIKNPGAGFPDELMHIFRHKNEKAY